MFQKILEAFVHDSGPKGSRKPRTYASNRGVWKLLEAVHCSGYCSYTGTVAADVSRGCQTSLGGSWVVCSDCLEPWGSRRAVATKGCSRLGNV